MSKSPKSPDWRDLQAEKKCLICEEYTDSPEQEALLDYLNTPRLERRGVRWHTFVTRYLRDALNCKGSPSTWARHVDLCLDRRHDR